MSSYDDSNSSDNSGLSGPIIFAIIVPAVFFAFIMITCCIRARRRRNGVAYPGAGTLHHGPRGIASYGAYGNPAGLRHPDPLIVAEQGLAQPPPAYMEQDPAKQPRLKTGEMRSQPLRHPHNFSRLHGHGHDHSHGTNAAIAASVGASASMGSSMTTSGGGGGGGGA